MSTEVRFRGGTAAEHASFVGAPKEITVDTTNWKLRVHDGVTPGGHVIGAALNNGDKGDVIVDGDDWRLKDFPLPEGRVTLTSGSPVQVANATAASFVYWTPFVGDRTALWDGVSSFRAYEVSELALSLAAAYHPVDKIYDLYHVRDGSGIIRLGTGPAWASDNSRGTGAASAETEVIKGVRVNKNAITVRPENTSSGATLSVPARAGTVVGWVRTTAAGQTEYSIAPTPAAGGTNNKLFLGNAYNKRTVAARCIDSTPSWPYASSTPRGMNAGAGAGNRISFIMGDAADVVDARLAAMILATTAGTFPVFGIALDNTTLFASEQAGFRPAASGNANDSSTAELFVTPGLGLHYVQAIEQNLIGTGTVSYLGGDQFRFTAKLAL